MSFTAEQLQARLRQIADDEAWSTTLRLRASQAAHPDAVEHGTAIEPTGLSDVEIWRALVVAMHAESSHPMSPELQQALEEVPPS